MGTIAVGLISYLNSLDFAFLHISDIRKLLLVIFGYKRFLQARVHVRLRLHNPWRADRSFRMLLRTYPVIPERFRRPLSWLLP